jgi:hypothetical protein
MLLLFFANFHCISGGWNKTQHQTVLAYWTDNTMGLIQLLDVFIDCGFYIATIKTNIVETLRYRHWKKKATNMLRNV